MSSFSVLFEGDIYVGQHCAINVRVLRLLFSNCQKLNVDLWQPYLAYVHLSSMVKFKEK